MNNYDLQGKRILFVGGGTGLDKAIIDRIHKSIRLQCYDNQIVTSNIPTHTEGDVFEFEYSSVNEIEKEIKEIISSNGVFDAAVRCLSIELAPKGIRVNSIQKGAVDTDFEKSHIQNVQAIRSDETIIDNQAPLGLVKADEVAELVAFLLSDATRSLTGQSILMADIQHKEYKNGFRKQKNHCCRS